jgi:hypothetical protein
MQGCTLGIAMVRVTRSPSIQSIVCTCSRYPTSHLVPKAYEFFTKEDAEECGSRVMLGGNRDRLVDCVEEFVKCTVIVREHFDLFDDHFSERRLEHE